MTDREKINKLYLDIKNIETPANISDNDLLAFVSDVNEGLGIILNAIKKMGENYKEK